MKKKFIALLALGLLLAMCICSGVVLLQPEYPNVYPEGLPFLRVGDQMSCRGGTRWTTTAISITLVRIYTIPDAAVARDMDQWLRNQWRNAASARDNRASLSRFPLFYGDWGAVGLGLDKNAFMQYTSRQTRLVSTTTTYFCLTP